LSRYQKGNTNLDFTEARDSEWQWHLLVRMQVCTSLQTDNHANTSPLSFLQAGCPSCRPTNSVKALPITSSMTKYHKGALHRIQRIGGHEKTPDLQQFCVKLHFFAAFCYIRYLQSDV